MHEAKSRENSDPLRGGGAKTKSLRGFEEQNGGASFSVLATQSFPCEDSSGTFTSGTVEGMPTHGLSTNHPFTYGF